MKVDYRKLIKDYENVHDEASVSALENFVTMYGVMSFSVLERQDYIYKNDMVLYKSLLIPLEWNLSGSIKEFCAISDISEGTLIYSKDLQRFFRIDGIHNVVMAILTYHEELQEIIKCTLLTKTKTGCSSTDKYYLAPEEKVLISHCFSPIGTCEDVTCVARYKVAMLFN